MLVTMCKMQKLTCLLEKVTSRFSQTKFSEIIANPNVMPPSHPLIDAEKEEMNGKFCENELSLMVNKAHFDNDEQWWVYCTVDISSINGLLPGQQSGLFGNFFKRWNSFRSRLESWSFRNNFPNKINNVNFQGFMYFRASYVLAGKSNAGNWKTILRLYYGKKFLSNWESTLLWNNWSSK